LTQAVQTAASCVGSGRLHAHIFMHANANHTMKKQQLQAVAHQECSLKRHHSTWS